MAARALIRRYLGQGQVDPHDIDQLVGVESKLKQQAEPDVDAMRLAGLTDVKPSPPKPPEAK